MHRVFISIDGGTYEIREHYFFLQNLLILFLFPSFSWTVPYN